MKISLPFIKKYAHPTYIDGLKITNISANHIPNIEEVDKKLDGFGWGAITVKGFVPPIIFMEFLAKKVLPIAVDMRTHKHIAYTPAPDIVHEAAGHAPIIADKDYADYLSAYGEIARNAIQSKNDLILYEQIRLMSEMKEDPNTDLKKIKEVEKEIKRLSSIKGWVSEATELARMNWWTIEYGLIGDLDNPKIYGAGRLSSVGESAECISDRIKKIPISIDCINFDYDITEPQPQLFVTPTFKYLTKILYDYRDTMAYKVGGEKGLEKAVLSEDITTAVYDSGLQVTGVLIEYIKSSGGEIIYLIYREHVQLSYDRKELKGHGPSYHQDGFGSALGVLSNCGLSLHEIEKSQLNEYGIIEGKKTIIEFNNGLRISGSIKKIVFIKNNPILISIKNCTVKIDNKILFKPEWGDYDLACGSKILSVFGGPADWDSYYKNKALVSKYSGQTSNLTSRNIELNKLYEKVHLLKTDRLKNYKYIPILQKLYKEYPDEWLILIEIYEIIIKDVSLEKEKKDLKNHIMQFVKNKELSDTILRGMEIIEKN